MAAEITISIDPKAPVQQSFTIYLRIPNRTTSALYTPVPQVEGYQHLSVNGENISPVVDKGYVAIRRKWKKGDKIVLDLPMTIQQVTADEKIEADRGRVALRYGPLVYNVETADNANINQPLGTSPLSMEWKGDLLHGVMAIKGVWADGSPLLAIPNYSRLNRTDTTSYPPPYSDKAPTSIVWIKK